jgi:23S rRNA (uridine2552-2'-O)-methyltransferase
MASNRNRWRDHYTRRATRENYPARSVYKLQEMQRRYKLIRKGDRVLDLGCSPGSWLLYAAELTTGSGQVTGIDRQPVTVSLPGHVSVYSGDVTSQTEALIEQIGDSFQVVLSDMAPATTGVKDVDAARSLQLCYTALHFADKLLQPGGNFACKIFQGGESAEFSEAVKQRFKTDRIYKPRSSRKASREIYIIGIGKI